MSMQREHPNPRPLRQDPPLALSERRLYAAFKASTEVVAAARKELNAINLFPVADADTGSNLAATLGGALAETSPGGDASLVARQFADGALLASLGNSGILMAEFLDGFAGRIGQGAVVSLAALPPAVAAGAERARAAISEPVEGTMLTAMDAWAQGLRGGHLPGALQRVEAACAATRDQLPVATKAGIVDAGAAGFLLFVSGFTTVLTDVDPAPVSVPESPATLPSHAPRRVAEPNLRYCTEILLEEPRRPVASLRETLADLGDSLIVAGGKGRLKVHLQCDRPDDAVTRLGSHGRLGAQKVDDMVLEYAAHHAPLARVAIVTDSACDLPGDLLDRWQIHQVPLTIQWGEDQFLDRRTLSASRFYQLVATRPDRPKTSQPPPSRFERLYRSLVDTHDTILGIHLSGKLSGTLASARLAAKRLPPGSVRLVDGRQLTAGLGLVVLRVAEEIAAGADIAAAAASAESLIPRTEVLVAVPSLDAMVRGGRVSPLAGRIAGRLGILPIVSVDRRGCSSVAGMAFSFDAALRRMQRIVAKRSRESNAERWALTHVNAADTAAELAEKVARLLEKEPEYSMDASPMIGAHAGPGAVSISVQWDRPPRRDPAGLQPFRSL